MRTRNHRVLFGPAGLAIWLALGVAAFIWSGAAGAQRPLDRNLQGTLRDWKTLLENQRVAPCVFWVRLRVGRRG